jgi:uncharacterized protein YkwD
MPSLFGSTMKLTLKTSIGYRLVAGLVTASIAAACGNSTTSPSTGSTSSGSSTTGSSSGSVNVPSVTDADLAFCASETNRYRAMRGRSPVMRSTALELYAADSARIDTQANQAHQHFISGNGGGISLAENEFLNIFGNGSVATQSAIQTAISWFYSEGPGGGHYENMMGFASLGCGVYRTSSLISVAQDFR